MAKKRITKEDIAPQGIFDNVTQGAIEAKAKIDFLNESLKVLKTTAETIKKAMPKSSPNSTKGLKDFDTLTKKANQTAKAKLGIDKQLQHHKAKLSQLQRDENKAIKTTIEAQSKLSQKQKQNLGTLQKIELSSRKLRAERAKLNLETKKGTKRLKEINSQLDRNNTKIRASSDAMKKQKLNVGNYGGAIGKLKGALGQLGLAFGVFSLIKNTFSIVRDFEQSQANLASVLGVNTKEMAGLTAQAKLLGETTKFTASEVAQLQLEYAKLGFSQDSIKGMTEATLQLAGATGSELGDTATVVGSTIRAFGLGAEDTQRVVDAMAKSFSSSSLDMEKFKTAMASVAPVAKSLGLNIEQTSALIGTLTDNGIDASTAGTGLRNMMLDAKKAGLTLDQALEKIKNSTDKVGTSFDLFGKRGATLGVVLAENTKATATLESAIYDAGGSAKEMADKQLNTLNGALALLGSAWEGIVLKFEEGTGVFGMLKDVVLFVAQNLQTLIKVFVTLGTVFGVYSLINKTTKAFKALTLAMNANPFVLIASAIAGIVVAIQLWSDEMTTAEKISKNLVDVTNEANKATSDQKAELSSLLLVAQNRNLTDEERIGAIEKLNEISPEYLGNLTLENVATEEGVTAIGNYVTALDKKAMAQAIAVQKQLLYVKLLEAETDTVIDHIAWYDKLWAVVKLGVVGTEGAGGVVVDTMKGAREEREENIKSIEEQIKALDLLIAKKIEDGSIDASDLTGGEDEDGEPTGTPKKLIDLKRKIRDEEIKQIEDDRKREVEASIEKTKRAIEDAKKTYSIASQKATLIKELEETLVLNLEKINKKHDDKAKQELNKFIKDRQISLITDQKKLILATKEGTIERLEAEEDLDNLLIQQIDQNVEIKLKKEKISSAEKKKIISEGEKAIDEVVIKSAIRRQKFRENQLKEANEAYTRAEKEKLLELLNSNKDQEKIAEEMLKFQIEQLEERIEFMKANFPLMEDEILDLEISLAQKKQNLRKKENKAIGDDEKLKRDLIKQGIDFATQLFVKSIDERIEKIDEEIQAHKDRATELEDLAKSGNIQAQDSIAEEKRLQAEAEQEKAEQEKRKQRILMISAFIQAYNSNLAVPGTTSGEALTKAFISQAFLDSVIENMGSFFDGTEDTGTVSKPLDSKGGRMAVIHDNERIMTSKQNSMIGSVSNEEVARVMEDRRLGRLVDGSQVAIGYENILLMNELSNVTNKLDQVRQTIQDKPELDISLGEITQTAMTLVETKKRKHTKTISTFKVQI